MIFRGTARAVIVALVAATASPNAMLAKADEVHIDSAFGVPQTVNGDNHDKVARHMAECNHYMMDLKDKDQDLFESCKNEHELCTHWALSGECTTNQQEMQEMCGPACKACDPLVHSAFDGEEEEEEEEELLDETESEELDETESEGHEGDEEEEEEEFSEGGEDEEDATEFDEEDATEFDEEDATEFDEEQEEDEENLAVEV
jgi:hypothetical protein